jgi:8-oxo-dGTP diphosphatase
LTPDYIKVGLLAMRNGRILLCRKKRATAKLILPGGKIEPGESNTQCLERELREELGDRVRAERLEHIGTYIDVAAGETKVVQIELYRGRLEGEPAATSEIGELVWFGPHDDRAQLAPSLRNQIIPDLIARRLLAW